MFPSAHICRNRSSRALECSGPCPSYPCGSSSTSPESCPHFARSAERNWSMIGCATFAKSPNCASQSVSVSGAAHAVAVLEPHHRHFAERRVVDLERRACACRRAGAARIRRRSSTSCSTACRCENVPRSTSWPEKRIETSSARIDANASASACPQSIPPAVAHRVPAALELLGEPRMRRERRRPAQQRLVELDRGARS